MGAKFTVYRLQNYRGAFANGRGHGWFYVPRCTDEQYKLVVSAQAYRPGHHSRLTMEFIGCIGCRQPCARTVALAGTADADMLPGVGSFGSRSDVGAAHDAPIPKRREDAPQILPVDAQDPHRVRMEQRGLVQCAW